MNDPKRESMPPVATVPAAVRLPSSPLTPGEREGARWLIRQALAAWREEQRKAA